MHDAQNTMLSLESRFDLAYNAAQTLGLGPAVWRILAQCHDMKNLAEYEGEIEVDTRIVTDLIAAVNRVQTAI